MRSPKRGPHAVIGLYADLQSPAAVSSRGSQYRLASPALKTTISQAVTGRLSHHSIRDYPCLRYAICTLSVPLGLTRIRATPFLPCGN
jgi:hypothetical protein